MVLHLAERLEVPLRERNTLLVAAGFAPVYTRTPLEDPHMRPAREALRQLLTGHEPYPAVVVDRYWNLLEGNASVGLLTEGCAPHLLGPASNSLRVSLHPEGMAPRILNLGEWRAHLLGRLRRQVELTADPELAALLQELREYPCEQPEPEVELPGPGDIFTTLRLRHEQGELVFFSTVATFGTPLDLTLAELVIESFYPADEFTADVLRSTIHVNGRT